MASGENRPGGPVGKAKVENYLEFLSAGGSDLPANILKKADMDVTSDHIYQTIMNSMDRTPDEIERILDEVQFCLNFIY